MKVETGSLVLKEIDEPNEETREDGEGGAESDSGRIGDGERRG